MRPILVVLSSLLIMFMSTSLFSNNTASEAAQAKYVLATDLIQKHGEVDIIVKVNSPTEITEYNLPHFLSITRINESGVIGQEDLTEVHACVVQYNFDQLVALGLDYEVLIPEAWEAPMGDFSDYLAGRGAADWFDYPSYSEYVDFLEKFEEDYPDICKLYNLGPSGVASKNHDIYAVRISDNVAVNEPEPRYLETNTIHGDETLNFMNCLHMMDTLLINYGTDTRITKLIDSVELWFVPNMNPDGTYPNGDNTVSNARRYNVANNWDLNRNSPSPSLDGQSTETYGKFSFYAKETEALMKLQSWYKFQFAQDQHGGTETYLWPYGGTYNRPKDEDWYRTQCVILRDQIQDDCNNNGFMTSCLNGIGNVYHNLYQCTGIRCDMNDWVGNGFSLTLESSNRKNLPSSELRNHWEWCREALFMSMEIVYKIGLHGIVTDGITGEPLNKVKIIRAGDLPNRNQLTDSCGRYVTFMNEGTHDLTYALDGYQSHEEDNFDFASYDEKYYLHVRLWPDGTNLKPKMKNVKALPYRNGIMFNDITLSKNAKVGIYNVKGKLIRMLTPQNNSIVWDGMDVNSRNVSNGCYVLKVNSNNDSYTKSFVLAH